MTFNKQLMIDLDLTNTSLFTCLLGIELKETNTYIDLHNDFNVSSVLLEQTNLEISLNSNSNTEIKLIFKDVQILNFNIFLNDITIDSFYRGRHEQDGQLYDEYNSRKCFYLDFDLGGKIILLCTKSSLFLPNSIANNS